MKVTDMSILPRLFLILGLSLLLITCRADSPSASVAPTLSPLLPSTAPPASPSPTTAPSATHAAAQPNLADLLAARQEADFTALPASMQQALQTSFDAQRAQLNAEQIQPVTLALVPQRVALVEDWALVLLAYENAYTDGIAREEPTTARQLGVRYLQRQSATDATAPWRVVGQDAVPAALQAALWGAPVERCLPTLCVRYRPFGLPSVAESMAGLDAYLEKVATDFGVRAQLPPTVTLTIEPNGSAMWQAAPEPKTFPLISAGVWDAQQASSPAVQRQGMAEALTAYLAAFTVEQRTLGDGESRATDRKAWPRLAHALVGWTRLSYWNELDKVTLQQRMAINGLAMPPLAKLLDPTQPLPYSNDADPYLLFSTFVIEHFGAGVQAGLLQQLFTAPDWETVARQSFPVTAPTLNSAWLAWLQQNKPNLLHAPAFYMEPFTVTQPVDLIGFQAVPSASPLITVATPVAHVIPTEICAPYTQLTNAYGRECGQKIEAWQLAQGLSTVARAGNQLLLMLANGTVETYTDTEGEGGGGWAAYSYINYLPELNAYLLNIQYYESSDFLLVRADNGEKTLIPAPPAIAPDGHHFFALSNRFENPLQLYLWQIEQREGFPHQQLRFSPISLFNGPVTTATWLDSATVQITTTSQSSQPGGKILVALDGDAITATYNNSFIQQPILDIQQINWDNESVSQVERAAIGKPIYRDRNDRFEDLPDFLRDRHYFLFANSRMHETKADYLKFHLYTPATLYVAIDSAACQLPGWLADWTLSNLRIETGDIPLNLYTKHFPSGDVILGGNEAPPAACIRSHYLLFVVEQSDPDADFWAKREPQPPLTRFRLNHGPVASYAADESALYWTTTTDERILYRREFFANGQLSPIERPIAESRYPNGGLGQYPWVITGDWITFFDSAYDAISNAWELRRLNFVTGKEETLVESTGNQLLYGFAADEKRAAWAILDHRQDRPCADEAVLVVADLATGERTELDRACFATEHSWSTPALVGDTLIANRIQPTGPDGEGPLGTIVRFDLTAAVPISSTTISAVAADQATINQTTLAPKVVGQRLLWQRGNGDVSRPQLYNLPAKRIEDLPFSGEKAGCPSLQTGGPWIWEVYCFDTAIIVLYDPLWQRFIRLRSERGQDTPQISVLRDRVVTIQPVTQADGAMSSEVVLYETITYNAGSMGLTDSKPELANMDLQSWFALSPQERWTVEGLVATPRKDNRHYYTELRVEESSGSLTWTPVATWQPFGLGYTTPRIVHWSTDGRYLYYTNAPHPDGCGLFVNASDLQRLDLQGGTVQEILPQNSTWVLAAAPDGTIAYIDGTTLVFFDPTNDTRQEVILDFDQSNVQLGNLVWSSDSQRLAFTVAYDACIPPMWQQAIYTVARQGQQLCLALPKDERRFQIVEWVDDSHLHLVDVDGQPWVLDVTSDCATQSTSSLSPFSRGP